ncbi:hypothetical protein GCM10010435_40520 [Winogradskya consettensis]|uniref:Spore-associated protein A n=1 Tax=Winogradskya consettensis TaxID=113560 RepID=A0A919SFF3_9ACTN|nr:hypothetical protein [Actinoplanes consettensis]GIM69723.1 hypothetical protein Aco04nite_16650 [Actinoplanes consettensis]
MTPLRRAALAALLLLTSLLAFAAPSPANADVSGSCSGTQIDSKAIKGGSHTYGTLYVYYDSSTGKNCAKATNTTGTAHQLAVWVFRCKAGSSGTQATCDFTDTPTENKNLDSGVFSSYAGPVHTLGSAAGRCIYAGAQMVTSGGEARADIWGHCG